MHEFTTYITHTHLCMPFGGGELTWRGYTRTRHPATRETQLWGGSGLDAEHYLRPNGARDLPMFTQAWT